MVTEKEQVAVTEEQVQEPFVESVSEDTKDVSTEETKEQPEVEAEAKLELKYSDADLKTRVQSAKDRELSPLQKAISELKTENKALKLAASDKQFVKDSELLYEEDSESNDEKSAAARKEARDRFGATLKEYRENALTVTEGAEKMKAVDALCEHLECEDVAELGSQMGAIKHENDSTIFALSMVLPKEKAILSKIESIVKRLGGAKTPAEDKLIREAIEAEGKGKSFTPAPLTKSGRVGKDLSDPHELIKEGFKKAREKK